jgi:hypothetical protein
MAANASPEVRRFGLLNAGADLDLVFQHWYGQATSGLRWSSASSRNPRDIDRAW